MPRPLAPPPRRAAGGLVLALLVTGCSGSLCLRGTDTLFRAGFENDTPGAPPSTMRPFGATGARLAVEGAVTVVQPAALGARQGARLERSVTPPATRLVATAAAPIAAPAFVELRGFAESLPNLPQAALSLRVLSSSDEEAVRLELDGGSWKVVEPSGVRADLVGTYDPRQRHDLLIMLWPATGLFDVCLDGDKLVVDHPFASSAATNVQRVELALPLAVTESAPTVFVADRVRIAR